MSFKPNDSQQMTLNNTLFELTDREKRMLDKSWATQFADKIFPLINEKRFSVLYSDKASRPNTPVNVIIGALILKELRQQTDDVPDYQVLVRVIREQTVSNPDGSFRLRTKEDGGMDSQILQNPADPEATYREKAGKAYRGYAANIAEAVSNNGSVVTNYQFESNTCSDPEFLDDYLDHEERTGEQKVIVTDGAYHSDELIKKADSKNIYLDGLEGCAQLSVNA